MDIDKIDQIQNVYADIMKTRNAAKRDPSAADPSVDAAMIIVLQCEILKATIAVSGVMSVLIDELRKNATGQHGSRLISH